ncbi:Htl1p SPAR_C00770 [Saccharomyces paradoxus]|uniref:Htl1p n=1 Tax=Saccharomyces paradoxus TaxID=27291 RepID=A0A8B8UMG6_SACPA|nr:uncharacterized protein SPAR_C00770 [Saccharomyces paradoxus]QHS71932.1 hypothetical protein SPAR_C00770 [Saccharomyces paradoxus]
MVRNSCSSGNILENEKKFHHVKCTKKAKTVNSMIKEKESVIESRVSVYPMSQNNTIGPMNPERAYNNVTLKNLTAFQLLSQRENICELLNLVEGTERHDSIINPERQRTSLEEMKKMLDTLKNEKKN